MPGKPRKQFEQNFGSSLLRNTDLLCKTCRFRMNDKTDHSNVSRCEKYALKPIRVLAGGNYCPGYKKGNPE